MWVENKNSKVRILAKNGQNLKKWLIITLKRICVGDTVQNSVNKVAVAIL